MNPINAESAAAGELTRQCRMAAGPTQEELSENAELSVRARQRNALTSCPADTSRVNAGSSSGFLPGRPPPAEVFSPILDLVQAPM